TGQTLFRDTFSQYGPLTTYLHVLALHVFGGGLAAVRLGTLWAYVLTGGILVATWRLLMPHSLVLCAFAVWLMMAPFPAMVPWSSVYALVFQSLSLLFLVLGLLRVRAW